MEWNKISEKLPPLNKIVMVRDNKGNYTRGYRWRDFWGNTGWLVTNYYISIREWKPLYN